MMKALFVITMRNTKGEVKIYHTDDMAKAICMQYSLFLNKSVEEVASTISDKEIDDITSNLQKELMDTIRNEECEVTINFFPPIND